MLLHGVALVDQAQQNCHEHGLSDFGLDEQRVAQRVFPRTLHEDGKLRDEGGLEVG